jgi:hypothetical protein
MPANGCETQLGTEANCRRCGDACGAANRCRLQAEYTCVARCPSFDAPNVCGETCVNFRTDRNNCGSCGRVCTNACLNGACF